MLIEMWYGTCMDTESIRMYYSILGANVNIVVCGEMAFYFNGPNATRNQFYMLGCPWQQISDIFSKNFFRTNVHTSTTYSWPISSE